ncbi:Hypothetical predicted protein [Lecanosticta acicola]|uniref:Transcriptional regulatory protein RXT2 N-terminal domain-containing protein n=1 Tax=Lecanosticta acicola TaxID=111012 RepID=A0AAI8YYS0_9PEZI|nr:Hypothetical predicted protein [Lecanosticta acicola]
MANQQLQFAETVRAMKLAMKRRPSDSGSDDEIRSSTNRGNKLKRSAKFVQQHRLDHTGGLAYKKRVNHAGYPRNIISTNPPLFDDDGDVYSPTSSDNEAERYGEPLEDDPFGQVRLEELLRPLTAAADLPNHPTLSAPYKAKALTQMAEEALDMLRRERTSLWKAKRLLQRFRGDADWVPCETFETQHDELLLQEEGSIGEQSTMASVQMDQPLFELEPPSVDPQEQGSPAISAEDVVTADHPDQAPEGDAMEGVEAVDMAAVATKGGAHDTCREGLKETDQVRYDLEPVSAADDNSKAAVEDDGPEQAPNPVITDLAERETASETASNSNGTSVHAMTTRARARSPAERSDRTPSPSPSESASVPAVHPWFVPPSSCLADRDLGLPAGEAEDTRKLLLLYVQKQEQVVRSLDNLYTGLQKADRLRHFVYQSCKAEAHLVLDGKGNMVTEMSDGEDWYDISDWDLQPWELKDGKLEKGKDEVEDVEEEGRRRPGRGRRVNRM